MRMMIDLAGTAALVTGASGGIGAAIAEHLGMSHATVALHYNAHKERAGAVAARIGGGSRCFHANLLHPTEAASLFDAVAAAMGTIDVLVNNAGVFKRSPLDFGVDGWLERWNETMAVNLTSAGVLCYKAIRHFMANGGGRIIHVASRAAFRGETENYLAYAASKGGLVSLSRSIARSFGKHNVKSFVVAPGWVTTPMMQGYIDERGSEIIERELSLREITTPADVAPLVTFIASGMMDHATGATIDINAGSYMR